MQWQSVFLVGLFLFSKNLMPCNVKEFPFVQQPANLTAFKVYSVCLRRCQGYGTC